MNTSRMKRKYIGFVPIVPIVTIGGGGVAGGFLAQAIGWPLPVLMAPAMAGGYVASRHLINRWMASG
ncbi:MAG: hypothetical protein JO079_14690 [Frankiaceae bacterium]|nr:hypothetical protein [Frankiaceae bacterium]